MDTVVSIAQNCIVVLALGFLYDASYRLHLHRPKIRLDILLGGIFSLLIAIMHFTPVLYINLDIHVAFVMLTYSSLVGGVVAGIMSLLIYVGIDVFIFSDPITIEYLILLLSLTGLGYALRVGYKSSVSQYTVTELLAVCFVLISLMILIPLVFNAPSLLFNAPILFLGLITTVFLVFMFTGVVLRRTMTLHQSEAALLARSAYEGFLSKAISDEIFQITFDNKQQVTGVEPLLLQGNGTFSTLTTPIGLENWRTLVHPEDISNTESFLKQLFLGETMIAELRIKIVATGLYEWRRVYGMPIKHPVEDYVYCAYIASKDISPEKSARFEHEAAQLERERVAILKAFSLQSEHQFRTPLSSIHTNLYLLRKVSDEQKRARYLDVIEEQARLMMELVESLSLLTQIEIRNELTEYSLNINEIVQGLLPRYIKEAEAKKVTIEAVLAEKLPKLRGNPLYIKSSIHHLIRNAVAYTPSGGNVTVITRVTQNIMGKKVIELVVEDTGVGMSDKVLAHAFERFYRADVAQTSSGLGLGLPLVKEVALYYGGKVNLFSTIGKGTVVVLSLPVM